jgi:hypothetical protein
MTIPVHTATMKIISKCSHPLLQHSVKRSYLSRILESLSRHDDRKRAKLMSIILLRMQQDIVPLDPLISGRRANRSHRLTINNSASTTLGSFIENGMLSKSLKLNDELTAVGLNESAAIRESTSNATDLHGRPMGSPLKIPYSHLNRTSHPLLLKWGPLELACFLQTQNLPFDTRCSIIESLPPSLETYSHLLPTLLDEPMKAWLFLNNLIIVHKFDPDHHILLAFFDAFFKHGMYAHAMGVYIIVKRIFWPSKFWVHQRMLRRFMFLIHEFRDGVLYTRKLYRNKKRMRRWETVVRKLNFKENAQRRICGGTTAKEGSKLSAADTTSSHDSDLEYGEEFKRRIYQHAAKICKSMKKTFPGRKLRYIPIPKRYQTDHQLKGLW